MVDLFVKVDQILMLQLSANSTEADAAVGTVAFQTSIINAAAQVHGIPSGDVTIHSTAVTGDARRLAAGIAPIAIQYSIPVASEAELLARMEETQDGDYRKAFSNYLKESEDGRVQGLQILSVYHRIITASNQDESLKFTALGDLFNVYGATDPDWDEAKLSAWGKSAAAAAEAALLATLSHIVPPHNQSTDVNVTETSAGPGVMSATFFMYASVPRDGNMNNTEYDVRVLEYKEAFNTIKDMDSTAFWDLFTQELDSASVSHLPSMSRTQVDSTTAPVDATVAPDPTPPPTDDGTKGASTSLILVIFLVVAFVLLLTFLCAASIWKNPSRRERYCSCIVGRRGDSVTRALSGDLEARDTVTAYNEGQDEMSKMGPRGAGLVDDDDPSGNGNVNFLDLIHFNNLTHIDTPSKAKKTPKRNGESPVKNRLTTQKLGSTDDKETEDLRFAMGTFKPWKSSQQSEKSGYRGSPASTRATTNSSRDSNSPNSITPLARPLGHPQSGVEDTPERRSLNRSPSEKSDDQVTIETVCSESETSSEEDD